MRVLIGGPVRQDPNIFRAHLEAIDRLWLPSGWEAARYYVVNDCPEVVPLLGPGEYEVIDTGDPYLRTEATHHWSSSNLDKMARLRNRMREVVLEGGWDWYLLVDSDVVVSPWTLVRLLSTGHRIVANIYWTEYRPGSGVYWPNCWDYGQAIIEDVRRWIPPGVYEVGGTGACCLIHRSVYEAGVDYTPIPALRQLWGEDRWFSVRAQCAGFRLWIDTREPVLHLYRREIYDEYMRLREEVAAGGTGGHGARPIARGSNVYGYRDRAIASGWGG